MSASQHRIAKKVMLSLGAQLATQDHNAFRRLAGSFKYEVVGNDIIFYGLKYALVINQGRTAGNAPPAYGVSGALSEWVMQKGIAKNPKEAKRIAFLISRKIAKEGTRENFRGKSKRGFIDKALQRSRSDIAKEYGNHFAEQMQMQMKKLISSNGNTIDIQL